MTLVKADLAESLANRLHLGYPQAKGLVDGFFDEISLCLSHGERVKISGLGNFNLNDKSERPGRNPKTGEDIPISARRVVTFHMGHKLKSLLALPKDSKYPPSE